MLPARLRFQVKRWAQGDGRGHLDRPPLATDREPVRIAQPTAAAILEHPRRRRSPSHLTSPCLDTVLNWTHSVFMRKRETLDPPLLLRQHGVQVTAQRLAVLRAVSCYSHGTVDEIEGFVRAEIGTVSRQAVYDALGTLTDKGLIRRIQPARSPARYEDRVDDNHHHLVCRVCGVTVDVDCAVGSAPCLQAANDHGFTIDQAEVIYWGRCPKCQQVAREDSQA